MRKIKIMPEYGMYPLWIEQAISEPFENISNDVLNLSTSLINQLDDWDAIFQKTLNEEYPPNSGFSSQNAEAAFEKKGVEIWEALISELPSDINVIYYSVIKKRLYEDILDLKNSFADK